MKSVTKIILLAYTLLLAMNVEAMRCSDPNAAVSYDCLQMQFINNTNLLTDDKIYLTAKGMVMNAAGKLEHCFLKFSVSGKGVCEPVTHHTDSTDYAYKLSQFNDGKIYLPRVISGRIYLSLEHPVYFKIASNLSIQEPDGFNPRDINYYTLYDKVEFTYNEHGTWMNPTAVDFFSLPIRISQPNATSPITEAGYASSRESVLNQIQQLFAAAPSASALEWQKLFSHFPDTNLILRIMSPGKAMVKFDGVQSFDRMYLMRNTYGINYIDAVWDYYKTHTILIDANELKCAPQNNDCLNDSTRDHLSDYHFKGQVVNDVFTFVNQDNSFKVTFKKPSSALPFFSGAGVNDAQYPNDQDYLASNNTVRAVIVRQLTSAFDVGLLPAADNELVNHDYFEKMRQQDAFYKANTFLGNQATGTGPWFDLYAMALHSFGEPIYTFAYDDALGQDGTLVDSKGADSAGGQPSPVTVTLSDLSGIKLPDPFKDDVTYKVQMVIGGNSKVDYDGKTYTAKDGEVAISNVKIPFKVKLNGVNADIYLKYPMVMPLTAPAGITINKVNDDTYAVSFPALP